MSQPPSPTPAAASRELFSLAGRAFVVTGAASGIGRAMAAGLLAHGARVLLVDREAEGLERLMDEHADSGRAHSGIADIAAADGFARVLDGFVQDAGGLDGLFANAGISGGPGFGAEAGRRTGLLEQQSLAQWQGILDVNLFGTARCMQAVLPALKARGSGRIVVTASISSLQAEPFVSYAYAVAKAGVLRLVQQSALELAPHGITVNAIAPGFIRTRIGGGRLDDPGVGDAITARVPLGRLGEADDVQGAAVFLASGASAYVTGIVIPVDGGYLLT